MAQSSITHTEGITVQVHAQLTQQEAQCGVKPFLNSQLYFSGHELQRNMLLRQVAMCGTIVAHLVPEKTCLDKLYASSSCVQVADKVLSCAKCMQRN